MKLACGSLKAYRISASCLVSTTRVASSRRSFQATSAVRFSKRIADDEEITTTIETIIVEARLEKDRALVSTESRPDAGPLRLDHAH
jgi:hypothetical protein